MSQLKGFERGDFVKGVSEDKIGIFRVKYDAKRKEISVRSLNLET